MTPRPVRLTPAEARTACLIGIERRLTGLVNGLANRTRVRADMLWDIDIEGAGAELAFAKAVGWFWDAAVGTSTTHRADVRGVHVRQTSYHSGHLLIRPALDVPGVYALVTGSLPAYTVRGWTTWPGCPGAERRPDPGRPPVWMVAQADLRDLAELDGQPAAAYGVR